MVRRAVNSLCWATRKMSGNRKEPSSNGRAQKCTGDGKYARFFMRMIGMMVITDSAITVGNVKVTVV